MSVLHTENVIMRFGGLTAVNDLNIEINKGEIVAVIGPNGAGKTTAFNMITGVYKPTSGDIFLGNEKITGLRPDIIAGKGIARTFQNIRLFKNLTVIDNVLIACHLRVKSNLFASMFHIPSSVAEEREIRKKSLNLLERTGLAEYKGEIASSLPYGLQRRLEIARALATNPSILLLDEPAAGMNPRESEDLTGFIQEISKEFDLSILLIEHHMQVVMKISNRIYVLDYGNIIATGTPDEIQNNPAVIKAYLGEVDIC